MLLSFLGLPSPSAKLRKPASQAVFFRSGRRRPIPSSYSSSTSASPSPHSIRTRSAPSAASTACALRVDHVSRRHYPLRHGLWPRHPRPRPGLRVRTVCLLTPRLHSDRRRPSSFFALHRPSMHCSTRRSPVDRPLRDEPLLPYPPRPCARRFCDICFFPRPFRTRTWQ